MKSLHKMGCFLICHGGSSFTYFFICFVVSSSAMLFSHVVSLCVSSSAMLFLHVVSLCATLYFICRYCRWHRGLFLSLILPYKGIFLSYCDRCSLFKKQSFPLSLTIPTPCHLAMLLAMLADISRLLCSPRDISTQNL